MRKSMILSLFLAVIFSAALVLAGKPIFAPATVNPSQEHAEVIIPEHAEILPGVFSLGQVSHNGQVVEGFMFVDYKKENAKPTGCNNDGKCQGWEDASCADCTSGGGDPGASTCFSFISKGAKWKSVEDYIVNPSNNAGLGEQFVKDNLADGINEWEDAADGTVNGVQGANILGDEVAGVVDGADTASPDDKNEVLFGDISSPGAIAVTIVWGIFRGPPSGRELIEWDQVYDDVDYNWSVDCSVNNCSDNRMDFRNIAQHELGHSIGMDHPGNECTEETMYAFASEGETKKIDLNDGDIAGVDEFY